MWPKFIWEEVKSWPRIFKIRVWFIEYKKDKLFNMYLNMNSKMCRSVTLSWQNSLGAGLVSVVEILPWRWISSILKIDESGLSGRLEVLTK